MYEDLVKALRCCAEPERCSCDGCPKLTADTYAGDCSLSVNNEAADALETLSAELERLKQADRWIPVAERLPKEGKKTITAHTEKGGRTMNELKSCPFCGKDVAEITNCMELGECKHFESCPATEPYVCVVCNMHEGGCGASSGYYDSAEKAIAAWNRRAEEGEGNERD
jgi:hypothetical protein